MNVTLTPSPEKQAGSFLVAGGLYLTGLLLHEVQKEVQKEVPTFFQDKVLPFVKSRPRYVSDQFKIAYENAVKKRDRWFPVKSVVGVWLLLLFVLFFVDREFYTSNDSETWVDRTGVLLGPLLGALYLTWIWPDPAEEMVAELEEAESEEEEEEEMPDLT